MPRDRAPGRSSFPLPVARTPAVPVGRPGLDVSHNGRVVFQEIRTRGRVTRGELAAITGLTKPTVVNVSRQLLEAGLILEAERASSGRGQPAWVLELNAEGGFAAGLNIDRDHLTLVALDLGGRVRGRVSAELRFALPHEVQAFVATAWARLVADGALPPERVVGLGIALPDDLGRLAFPGKPDAYAAWSRADPATLLIDTFSGPTFVENDAIAAAIGEAQFGHGMEAPGFVYVLISVLLGGGIVVDGSYLRGETGRSGEIGFLRVPVDGGSRPLQDLVSLTALFAWAAERGLAIAAPADLATLDAAGAALVDEWLDQASGHLAAVFAQIGQVVDPDAILLGGRLPEPLLDRLAALCRGRSATGAPAIRRARLSGDAPAIGAAILPFQQLLFPSLQRLGRF